MRLMRAGKAGYEKPTLVCDNDERRDISIFLSEIDEALLGCAWSASVAAIDPGLLPPVAGTARAASCLERAGRIFLTEATGSAAGEAMATPRLGVKSARPIGAHDTIRLPRVPGTTRFTAGVAAVAGGRTADGDPVAIAGFCLFVNGLVDPAADLDATTAAAVSSAPSLLALGPYLVSPDDPELRLPFDIRASVDGQDASERVAGIDLGHAARIVARVDRLVELQVGDVVLVGGLAGATVGAFAAPQIRAGDRIVAAGGRLGSQAHVCEPA